MNVETIAGGRYRVERPLGDGAMAKVLLAHDGELGRLVALKLLDERLARDESFRARFAREARVAASLSHPNVVTVFDVGETDGVPYIVMEYVAGRTLAERLRAEGPLPPGDVRQIALQVCAGLEHAHASGLVHRDLKPGNLIQRADGTVKIGDFGIARAVETTELTEAGTILGTAAYLAPEQAEGGEITHRTDLFSLGIVLYELLSGQPPWKVDSLAALAARSSAAPPELPPGPPELQEAIARCLAANPDDRPASASEIRRMLERADDGATAVLASTPPLRRRTPQRPRPVWPAVLAAAALLALAAAGIAVLTSGEGGDASDEPPPPPAQVEPIPDGATPAEDARALAEWLRKNSR